MQKPAAAILTVLWIVALAFQWRLVTAAGALRPDSFAEYLHLVVPLAAAHVVIAVLLALFGGRTPVISFWVASFFGLCAIGGWRMLGSMALLMITAGVLILIGSLAPAIQGGVTGASSSTRITLGITSLSFIGVLLAEFKIFRTVSVAIAVALLAATGGFALLTGRERSTRTAEVPKSNGQATKLLSCLVGELGVLVALFYIVAGSAPERNSDALRIYLPYIRYLASHGTILSVPQIGSYVIPQAGLTFEAAILAVLGSFPVRFSMVLCLAAAVGIVGSVDLGDRFIRWALAFLVASTPLVIWVSTSLMQDILVALVTTLLATVCITSPRVDSTQFWVVAGGLAGFCWTAKYSSLPYTGLALAIAAARGWNGRSALRSAGSWLVGGLSAMVTAAPWVLRTWHESGNPFFPFLNGLFPSANFPRGIGLMDLAQYKLDSGILAWLSAPISLTFSSNTYSPGFNGTLGLTFLVLLSLSIVGLLVSFRRTLPWLIVAGGGAAALWLTTSYLRYWMTSLWLLVPPAAAGATWLFRTKNSRTLVATLAVVTAILHIPIAMANSFSDPQGLPIDYFLRRMSYRDYVRRLAPGFEAMQQLVAADGSFPRVIFTGFEMIGHWRVAPMEAAVWEFMLHDVKDSETLTSHVKAMKADYWIVNAEDEAARNFKRWRADSLFWRPEYLVFADGPLEIYRIPWSQHALAVSQRVARSRVKGIDLARNGSFEVTKSGAPVDWTLPATAHLVALNPSYDGKTALEVGPDANVTQVVALPPGFSTLELVESVRAGTDTGSIPVRLQVNWSSPSGDMTGANIQVVTAGPLWKQFRMLLPIPQGSSNVTIWLTNYGNSGTSVVDSVRLNAFH